MFEGIVPLLALGTLLCVCIFALINAERTKDRMRDPNAPTSTLAKDGKYGGVAFLRPLTYRWSYPRDPLGHRPQVVTPETETPVDRGSY